MRAHAQDLRVEVQDDPNADAVVQALCRGEDSPLLSQSDATLLQFAIKLTRSPAAIRRADIEELRAVGFDDRAIHHIVQVTALFNYYNRLADGLGIDPEPEWEP